MRQRTRDDARAGTLLDQAVTLGRQGESPLYRAEALDALGSLLARTPRGDQNGAAEQREATEIYEALGMRRPLGDKPAAGGDAGEVDAG